MHQSADKNRVTAQLIDAAEGFHLFSDIYDGGMKDIFAVRDDLALLVDLSAGLTS